MEASPNIDPEKIAAVYTDEQEKTQFIFTKEQLINQLTKVVLGIMGYTMLILDIVTEMVFIDEIEAGSFWKVLGAGQLQFIPPKEDRTGWMAKLLKEKVIPAKT